MAARSGHLEIVKFLVLECGSTTSLSIPEAGRVDVDAPVIDGRNALFLALQNKKKAVAQFLLREGKVAIDVDIVGFFFLASLLFRA